MKKKTFNTKTVVFGAFLVAIAFLLGGGFARFTGIPTSIKINFGGAQQSIGFTAVPLVIGSIVLGPMPGLVIAAIYDTLTYIFITGGVWNPIFTISEIVIGVLPGLIYKYIFNRLKVDKPHLKLISAMLVGYLISIIMFSSFIGEQGSKSQKAVQMISFDGGFHIMNGILLACFVVAGVLSILLVWYFGNRKKETGLFTYDKLYLVTFLGLLLRSLISGWGLWLYLGKTIPLIYYWLPRFITPLFTAPICAFAISKLSYVLKKYTK